MSSRALRKLQREQELQKQIAAVQAEDEEQESEEEDDEQSLPLKSKSAPTNAFDMLEDVEDEDDTDEVDAGASLDNAKESTPQPALQKPSRPTKSKRKKKKSKKKGKDRPVETAEMGDQSEDEVDRAMRELAVKDRHVSAQDQGDEEDAQATWRIDATKLLGIDPRTLNPINEMKSLFGNVALEEQEPRSDPRHQRRRDVNQHGGVDLATALTGRYCVASKGKELGALAGRRNCLMRGKEEWPLAASGGLGMEATSPKADEKHYNIVHNDAYKETQHHFLMAVEAMDPQRMMGMLSLTPYHIATLLQVSEIARHQGDHSVSGDLIERALYSFGKSVHSSFPTAMRDGLARVPYDRSSNRELHLTIWRYIRNLEMRGTWRTAFEWARLLLQLDPIRDPMGVTLMIDQLALRGRSHLQLIELMSENKWDNAWRHLPNIQISLSISYLRAKQPKLARQQLAIAIHQYPYILSALASALDISPPPKSLWAKLPSTDAEKLYTELYVTCAKDLWNTPETSSLLVEVAETLAHYTSITSTFPPPPRLDISLEDARHIMLLEIPSLIALLPRHFTRMPTSTYDVLPPPSQSDESDTTFTARAPGAPAHDAIAPSGLQTLLSATSAIANVTGDGLARVLNFFTGASRNTEEDNNNFIAGFEPEEQELIRDIQAQIGAEGQQRRLEEAFGPQGMTDAQEFFGFEDSEGGDGDSADESMPSLEDIPTQSTRPPGAVTPEPQTPLQTRPRAAMVEDEGEDDQDIDAGRGGPVLGRAVLRHVDSDDEDQRDVDSDGIAPHPAEPTHTLMSNAPIATGSRNTRAAAEGRPEVAEMPGEDIPESKLEDDPQRLQRWLLTTGYSQVQESQAHVQLFVRRLKLLRRQQQEWILHVLGQRGEQGRRVAASVRGAME